MIRTEMDTYLKGRIEEAIANKPKKKKDNDGKDDDDRFVDVGLVIEDAEQDIDDLQDQPRRHYVKHADLHDVATFQLFEKGHLSACYLSSAGPMMGDCGEFVDAMGPVGDPGGQSDEEQKPASTWMMSRASVETHSAPGCAPCPSSDYQPGPGTCRAGTRPVASRA